MRAALLLVLAVPTLAFAQAGRFLLAAGEVTIVRGSQQIPASIGSAVAVGDTVRLGARSGAQIRMSDETIVALRSNTIFRIDEHVFSGQGDENDRTVFSLLKGGMRAVTGVLARQPGEGLVRTAAQPVAPSPAAPAAKPGAKPTQSGEDSEGGLLGFIRAPLRAVAGAVAPTKHSVRLPTATVGIRGTHYTLVHCDNDCYVTPRTRVAAAQVAQSDTGTPGLGNLAPNGSYGGVSDGLIGIVDTNREFGANEFFYIAPDGSIQSLIAPPSFLYDTLEAQERNRDQNSGETTAGMAGSGLNAESRPSDTPAPPTPAPFIVTEQRNTNGDPVVLAGAGPAPTIAFLSAFPNATGGPSTVGAFINDGLTTEAFSGDGFFVELTSFSVAANGGYSGSSGSVNDESSGGANTLGAIWGRWLDGSVTDASGTTTINSQTGTLFHYLVGPNTPPEVIAARTGSVGFGLVGSSVSNNFGEFGSMGSGTIAIDFTTRTASFPATTFSFGFSNVQNWNFSPSSSPITIQPGQGAFIQNTATGTCAGSSCSTLTNVNLSRTAVFMGPAGDHLGVAMRGVSTGGTGSGSLQGTAIFSESSGQRAQ
jgi:hypothetical protein